MEWQGHTPDPVETASPRAQDPQGRDGRVRAGLCASPLALREGAAEDEIEAAMGRGRVRASVQPRLHWRSFSPSQPAFPELVLPFISLAKIAPSIIYYSPADK